MKKFRRFREWLNGGKKIGERKCGYQLLTEMYNTEFKKRR